MGRDKAQVQVDGSLRMVDVVLRELSPLGGPIVVVSPSFFDANPSVLRTCENPPFGGPVAGIQAGFDELTRTTKDLEAVAVVAVDAPHSPRLVPVLVAALEEDPKAGAAVVRAADGFVQPLCALWRVSALREALDTRESWRDCSAKSLFRALTDGCVEHNSDRRQGTGHSDACSEARWSVVEVAGTGEDRDYDSPEELPLLFAKLLEDGGK